MSFFLLVELQIEIIPYVYNGSEICYKLYDTITLKEYFINPSSCNLKSGPVWFNQSL